MRRSRRRKRQRRKIGRKFQKKRLNEANKLIKRRRRDSPTPKLAPQTLRLLRQTPGLMYLPPPLREMPRCVSSVLCKRVWPLRRRRRKKRTQPLSKRLALRPLPSPRRWQRREGWSRAPRRKLNRFKRSTWSLSEASWNNETRAKRRNASSRRRNRRCNFRATKRRKRRLRRNKLMLKRNKRKRRRNLSCLLRLSRDRRYHSGEPLVEVTGSWPLQAAAVAICTTRKAAAGSSTAPAGSLSRW
mmetsp:Transcript_6008/g.19945  ORF Transcript_6008/g.19945 Transcript_6008/m.19945 type:complete len:243 (+) Transcript_6008:2627-3355(+)